MGKKRIVKTGEDAPKEGEKGASQPVSTKKRVEAGVLYVQSTYNNTKVILTDTKGNALAWSSSGSMGFKGAKKGTPFAAAKVGEVIGAKATTMGMKDASVIVRGVGSGRESAIRAFMGKSINISKITDMTPVPFNGPKPKKPRRV